MRLINIMNREFADVSPYIFDRDISVTVTHTTVGSVPRLQFILIARGTRV